MGIFCRGLSYATHRTCRRAEQVEKRFGNILCPCGVSLEIEAGIIYALLGPNGAGKTTLIRVLATLLRPDGGTATVAGIDVVHDPVAVRNRIGLAGQFAAVDEYLTGREAVEMVGRLYNLSPRTARDRAAEVLERFSLGADADRLVRTYSGGMKRRLDLAASLVGRPDVLFLDEPTTGIDPRSRLEVWRPLPLAADGALRGARRAHAGRSDPQRPGDRADDRVGLRARLPAADLVRAAGGGAAGGAGVRLCPVVGHGLHRSGRQELRGGAVGVS